MNIRYLEEFIVLSEYSSINKAAQALHISQPALSKHISALEVELGVTLVDRNLNDTILTPYGKAFLENARQISFLYNKAIDEMKKMKMSRPMKLRVEAFIQYQPLSKLLHDSLFLLNQEYPLLQFELVDVKNTSPFDDVRSGKVDLCILFASKSIDISDLQTIPLFKEEMCVIARKTNPLTANSKISPQSLDGVTIHFPQGKATQDMMDTYEELLVERGSQPIMSGFPWVDTHSYLEFFLDKGVFFETVGATHDFIPASYASEYEILRFDEPFYKTNSIYYRSNNDNPMIPLFVKAAQKVIAENNPDYLEPI